MHVRAQDGAQAQGFVAALARAAAQRSLRRGLEARRLSLACRLQADRDRRQASLPEAGQRRRRPRRGARRLEPDRGRARAVDRPAGQVVAIDYLADGAACRCRGRCSSISWPRRPKRGSRRCCATATPTSCCRTWRRRRSATRAPTICASWGSRRRRRISPATCCAPGGAFLAKVLQGGTERELLDLLKSASPPCATSSRRRAAPNSAELYVLATGFRPE